MIMAILSELLIFMDDISEKYLRRVDGIIN